MWCATGSGASRNRTTSGGDPRSSDPEAATHCADARTLAASRPGDDRDHGTETSGPWIDRERRRIRELAEVRPGRRTDVALESRHGRRVPMKVCTESALRELVPSGPENCIIAAQAVWKASTPRGSVETMNVLDHAGDSGAGAGARPVCELGEPSISPGSATTREYGALPCGYYADQAYLHGTVEESVVWANWMSTGTNSDIIGRNP